MSIFDKFKDKASEMLQGAGEKVSEATGIDLPIGDATEQMSGATDGLGDSVQGHVETAQGHVEGAQGHLDNAQGHVDNAQDAATDRLGDLGPGQK